MSKRTCRVCGGAFDFLTILSGSRCNDCVSKIRRAIEESELKHDPTRYDQERDEAFGRGAWAEDGREL